MSRRIQVPINSDLDKALDDWCELSGESRAAVCSAFLSECTPVLREMTKSLRAAQRAPEKALDNYAGFLQRTLEQAKQVELQLKAPRAKK